MGEPLTRSDSAETSKGEGLLADSATRLERALASLEASMRRTVAEAGDAAPGVADAALAAELDAARARTRELEAAAEAASDALGRAMTEVSHALAADEAAAGQGELDFALETQGPLADDGADAAGEPPREDPAG